MTKHTQDKAEPEALATFAAAARSKGVQPVGQGGFATPETSGKPGDLAAEENTPRVCDLDRR
jgi:hypothetical protein